MDRDHDDEVEYTMHAEMKMNEGRNVHRNGRRLYILAGGFPPAYRSRFHLSLVWGGLSSL